MIEWVLGYSGLAYSGSFTFSAQLRAWKLSEKLPRAVELYPCDLLFVHRDAERPNQRQAREKEIAQAVATVGAKAIPVIPMRMTEAWLLWNESAIRRAADNPNGREPLALPAINQLEQIVQPKDLLLEKIALASGLPARRIDNRLKGEARALISTYIEDFVPLRGAKAFDDFCVATENAINTLRG